jgi:hypothetical protein
VRTYPLLGAPRGWILVVETAYQSRNFFLSDPGTQASSDARLHGDKALIAVKENVRHNPVCPDLAQPMPILHTPRPNNP